eukprot:72031_1
MLKRSKSIPQDVVYLEDTHSPRDTTLQSKTSSSMTHEFDNISYSNTAAIHKLDLVTPLTSYIHDEKAEIFEQRLAVLQALMTDNNHMKQLSVYVSLEYILNCNPDPLLLKHIHNALPPAITAHALRNYLKQNKNELIEYLHLNTIESSHYCQWKLDQILSLERANDELESIKIKYEQLKHQLKSKQAISHVRHRSTPIAITRTSNERLRNREWTVSKTRSSLQKALVVWKEYTDRLLYIKQRYPTEYMDRHKAWQGWSSLLNTIEETGQMKIEPSKYIDFARMSLGRYGNWIRIKTTKWIRKYLVLMDFNLFLFDTKTETQCLRQILPFEHMVMSIASIRRVIPSTETTTAAQFALDLRDHKSVQIQCDNCDARDGLMEEFIYQMKCVNDLLKLPQIKLKPADPHANIWVPAVL